MPSLHDSAHLPTCTEKLPPRTELLADQIHSRNRHWSLMEPKLWLFLPSLTQAAIRIDTRAGVDWKTLNGRNDSLDADIPVHSRSYHKVQPSEGMTLSSVIQRVTYKESVRAQWLHYHQLVWSLLQKDNNGWFACIARTRSNIQCHPQGKLIHRGSVTEDVVHSQDNPISPSDQVALRPWQISRRHSWTQRKEPTIHMPREHMNPRLPA